MPKTLTVQDAEQQLAAATATVDQLKAKILDHGPGSVTAEELGTAALAVEHANLAVQHAIKAAEEAAQAARLDHLEERKAYYLDQAGDADTIRDAMDMIAEGTAVIVRFCAGRQRLISQGTREMREAGVPRYEVDGKQRTTIDGRTYGPATELVGEHAGMGWREAGMGRSDVLYIDGRQIADVSAGVVVASAVARGLAAAGRKEGHLSPLSINSAADPAAVNDPDAWLARRF